MRDFAQAAIADGPMRADDDRTLFDLGVQIFDKLKRINREIADRLQQQVTAARTDAQQRLDLTVALIVLIGIGGGVACGLVGLACHAQHPALPA